MPRINRAIELLAAGQSVYCTAVEELSYQRGLKEAGTWADYLTVDLEHHPFELSAVRVRTSFLGSGTSAGSHLCGVASYRRTA